MTVDHTLRRLGIELPLPTSPAGLYVPAVRAGDLVFLSGTGPVRADGSLVTGKVGRDLDIEDAREAARLTGLQILAVLAAELGSLDRVTRVVKLLGMVNCAPGFNRTPQVIDGCSELLVDVLGDAEGVEAVVVLGQLHKGGAFSGDGHDHRPDVLVLDVVVALDLVGDAAQVVPQGGEPAGVVPVDELGRRAGEPVEVDGHRAVHDGVVGEVGHGVAGPAWDDVEGGCHDEPSGCGSDGQARLSPSPVTVTGRASRGRGAGPAVTEPSVMANLLPWHGQLIVPSDTVVTAQP